MDNSRIVCWFSCGAASAVATKLCPEAEPVYCETVLNIPTTYDLWRIANAGSGGRSCVFVRKNTRTHGIAGKAGSILWVQTELLVLFN